jgi:hypothetical protein
MPRIFICACTQRYIVPESNNSQAMDTTEKEVNLNTYKWIKIPRYKDDRTLSWEERFVKLQEHHIQETQFLIDKVRELVLLSK